MKIANNILNSRGGVNMSNILIVEKIEHKIYLLRGRKVMLDIDLAKLYWVPTKRLNEQVRRNIERFPEDFMFRLSWDELECLRSQFATLKNGGSLAKISKKDARGRHVKHLPYAFTEEGIAMLSSVLRSRRAVQMNILIMRAFVRIRQFVANHQALAEKFKELETRVDKHDSQILSIVEAIKEMIKIPEKPKRRIGFVVDKE